MSRSRSPGGTVSVFCTARAIVAPFLYSMIIRKWHLSKWARICYHRKCPKDEYETNCCTWLRTRGKTEIRRLEVFSSIPHPYFPTHFILSSSCLCRTQAVFSCPEASGNWWHCKGLGHKVPPTTPFRTWLNPLFWLPLKRHWAFIFPLPPVNYLVLEKMSIYWKLLPPVTY